MIEQLTIEKLENYGCPNEHIEAFTNDAKCELNFVNDSGRYFASNIEGLIYSGSDEWFRTQIQFPFVNPSWINEYYNRKLDAFLTKMRAVYRDDFNKTFQTKSFIKYEKTEMLELIKTITNRPFLKHSGQSQAKIEMLDYYLIELREKLKNIEADIQNTLPTRNPKKQIEQTEKQLEPILWNGTNKKDIAYIFWQLEKLKLIECNHLAETLSKVFMYNNEVMSYEYFTTMFSKFNTGKESSTNAIELDKILLQPKKQIKKL